MALCLRELSICLEKTDMCFWEEKMKNIMKSKIFSQVYR